MTRKRLGHLLAGLLCLATALAQATPPPTGLLCNLLAHPEKTVITDPRPDFDWIPASNQGAYQILVSASREAITASRGDVWDSGKVDSSQSINIAWGGKTLAPHTSYWWAVRTWDRHGEASPYSAPQRFNTGEFGAARRWPGESRWVQLKDEAGQSLWTLEDRHPIAYHPHDPIQVLPKPNNTTFFDFGRAAFATLTFTADWRPATPPATTTTLTLALGEKRKGDGIDPRPGGGIIYRKVTMPVQPGRHDYTLQLPRWKPRYPHSQPLPAHMPEVIPFRYAEIQGAPAGFTIESPRQLALHYEFDDTAASFKSSSEDLNRIYELCKYSVKVNTFNGDYAASERERMLYEADTYIHQLSHYAVDHEYAIARYSVENMIYHNTWPTEWTSHVILMAWADYLNTGNKKLIEREYDELKPKTMLALAGPDELISTRTGKQTPEFRKSIHLAGGQLKDIVDWPTGESDGYVFTDINTVVNAFHYRSLVLMGHIAGELGKTEDARVYEQRAAEVKRVINEKLFDRERGIYVDGIGTPHASLHANMFPLAFGLVPDEHMKTVADFVKSRKMACSVYPANYLLEALYDAGEDQAALDLLLEPGDRGWLNMLRVGSTITTEAWDVKYKANAGWTHAWSASPAHILPRKLVGIEPLEPGFGKIMIKPRPGNLRWAEATMPTIRGAIKARFERLAEKTFILKVDLPANVTATIALPAPQNGAPTITLDGKPVSGKIVDGRVLIEAVGQGRHTLETR